MTYLIIGGVVLFFLIWLFSARKRIMSVYKKYIRMPNDNGISGERIAIYGKESQGLDIKFALVKGTLTDAYSSKQKTLYLSQDICESESLASCAVVAHELGHAMQDKENMPLFRITHLLNRFTHFTNRFIFPLLIFGLAFMIFKWPTETVGLNMVISSGILFVLHALFKLLTIPVETDASKRAIKFLVNNKIITKNEIPKIKKFLRTAAQTYIVALFDDFVITARKLFRGFR